MVEILSNEISDFKVSVIKRKSDVSHLTYLENQTDINMKSKTIKLKFGGVLEQFVVVVTLEIGFKSKLSEQKLLLKFDEYALDIQEDLAERLLAFLKNMPKDIL